MLDDELGTRLLRTVRAGDGYLSQSSRWVHFGLGPSEDIRSIEVRWPNGNRQSFEPPQVDARYRLTERSEVPNGAVRPRSVAEPVDASESTSLAVDTSQPPSPIAATLATQNTLTRRFPLPRLPYTRFDGVVKDAAADRQRPLLVSLWSTTCATCCTELTHWARAAAALPDGTIQLGGADVVALSIDQISASTTVAAGEVETVMRRMQVPFASGMISDETFFKLQLVHNQIYDHDRPLPVPTSFLIDTHGALAAMYKGPVPVERIQRDVRRIADTEEQLLASALPSPGRWVATPGVPCCVRTCRTVSRTRVL